MNDAWERPPEYDDPPDAEIERDRPSALDGCLNCGVCESCIDRSIAAAEEHQTEERTMREPQAASINATAKLWTVYSGEYTPDDGSEVWGAFWEPLSVSLSETARPHCCYANQIAFYDRTGNKLLKDFVQHYGFTASLHPHLLFLAGKWQEVVNGRCEYRDGRWWMRWGVATNTHWAMKLNGHLGAGDGPDR